MLIDIGPRLQNQRQTPCGLEPRHRLLLALRFFATGDFCYSVRDSHGVSKASVHNCINRVTQALSDVYFGEVVSWPRSETARQRIAGDFFRKYRFPAVCGALDGTLIPIMTPSENEWQFVDRKGSHSLNVLAIAGPDYQFYAVNANWPGSVHDARVHRESAVCRYVIRIFVLVNDV